MKKLLLLLLLVGVNANGADRPIRSDTGLEGIAESGLVVAVEPYDGIDAKAIENQVRLRLVQAGIKTKSTDDFSFSGMFYVNAQPVGQIISMNIEAKRQMTFEANGKTYRKLAIVWSTGGILHKDNLRKFLGPLVLETIED